MNFQLEETEGEAHDWEGEVKIDLKLEVYPDKFIGLMTEFDPMWDGHLSRICIPNHCIEITSDESQPVHCAPYKAGPEACESENTVINKKVKWDLSNQLRRNGPLV